MAIPAGISTALVHMDAPLSFIGEAGRLHVEIEPSATLVWAETGTPIANFFDSMDLDEGQALEVYLPHTDQDGFLDGAGNTITGWFYTVKITYEKEGQLRVFPERDFQILTGQTSIDLALVPTGVAVTPATAPILPVTSIAGLSGAVTLAALGLDLVSILSPDPVYPGLYRHAYASTADTVHDGGDASTTSTDTTLDGGTA